jgi:hypothetical protein
VVSLEEQAIIAAIEGGREAEARRRFAALIQAHPDAPCISHLADRLKIVPFDGVCAYSVNGLQTDLIGSGPPIPSDSGLVMRVAGYPSRLYRGEFDGERRIWSFSVESLSERFIGVVYLKGDTPAPRAADYLDRVAAPRHSGSMLDWFSLTPEWWIGKGFSSSALYRVQAGQMVKTEDVPRSNNLVHLHSTGLPIRLSNRSPHHFASLAWSSDSNGIQLLHFEDFSPLRLRVKGVLFVDEPGTRGNQPACFAVGDIDGDGLDEIAYVAGQRVQLVAWDGRDLRVFWSSAPLYKTENVLKLGVCDLTGDGRGEVVAFIENQGIYARIFSVSKPTRLDKTPVAPLYQRGSR